ncbi:MAG: hypothetical protein ACREIV_05915, partial [Planctomycetaceae bacterium]
MPTRMIVLNESSLAVSRERLVAPRNDKRVGSVYHGICLHRILKGVDMSRDESITLPLVRQSLYSAVV